ncbi:hypothetical protein MNBD_PLANCTO03-908 [hydrothermal vent metagenome]|uniref:Uncharacterized protein n=1 Tax=hydrothermal vent metagenome TaxID=652676 RepID=A0A3B1DPG2_9ZZZZ
MQSLLTTPRLAHVLVWFAPCMLGSLPAGAQPATDPIQHQQPDPWTAPDTPNGEDVVHWWSPTPDMLAPRSDHIRGCAPFRDVGSNPEGDSPAGVAFSPDGTWFVVAHRQSHNLLIYDSQARTLLNEIALSGSPVDLAVSRDGRWAVTPNLFEDTVSIVDLHAGYEVAVLPAGDGPILARITPDSTTAVIGTTVSDELIILDLASASELRRIPGLHFEPSISVNTESFATRFTATNRLELASDDLAVFADLSRDRVGFVSIDTGAVEFISTARRPYRIALTPDGRLAVVSHPFTPNLLSVIDVPARLLVREIEIDGLLYPAVAVNPDGTKAVVSVENDARFIDLLTGEASPNLNTGPASELITTADGQYALAVGLRGSLLSYAAGVRVKNVNNAAAAGIGAVSPVDHRAVLIETGFGEDMAVVNTNGSDGHLEEVLLSGPGPEGDKPRTIAITPDGDTVLVANSISRNLSVFDADTMALRGWVPLADRPARIAVTPDSSTAVVTNRGAPFVTVIDIKNLQSSLVPISRGGDQVSISPDGEYAYIAVTSLDGVWRINLHTQAVDGPKIATGNMGGVGYHLSQYSGMTLSHDGSMLATCDSFSDTITIIDADAWTFIATVSVGQTPTAASFSPDDARIYVSNRDDDSISVVELSDIGWSETEIIPVGDIPYQTVVTADGQSLYVMNTGDVTIGVVDTGLLMMVDSIPLDHRPVAMLLDDLRSRLFVAIGNAYAPPPGEDWTQSGALLTIDTNSNAVIESHCTEYYITDLDADRAFRLAAAAGVGGESAVFFDIASCVPDLNGDGTLDSRDFIIFLAAWADQHDQDCSQGDCSADFNADGTVDTADFTAYLAAWTAGC